MAEVILEFIIETVFFYIIEIIEGIFGFIIYIIIKIIYGCLVLIWKVIKFFHKLIFKKTQDESSFQPTINTEASKTTTQNLQPESKILIKSYRGRGRLKALRTLRKVAHNLSFSQALIILREGGEINVLEDINNLSNHYQVLNDAGINFELII